MKKVIIMMFCLFLSMSAVHSQELKKVQCENWDVSKNGMNCFIGGKPANAEEVNSNFKVLNDELVSLEARISTLKTTVDTLDRTTSKWPAGNYCILNNKGCPAGFTLSEGHMRSVYLYAAGDYHIRPATFGNSSIKCHEGPCGQRGHYAGELHLSVCCK